jgi:hypothetical protein
MIDFSSVVKEKTDDELAKMIAQLNEWSPEMLSEVEKELSKRNMLPVDLEQRKKAAIIEEDKRLSQGKKSSVLGTVLGWLLSLGIIGFAIGYHYAFSTTRSRYTGKSYPKYDLPSRNSGRFMMYTTIGTAILWLVVQAF